MIYFFLASRRFTRFSCPISSRYRSRISTEFLLSQFTNACAHIETDRCPSRDLLWRFSFSGRFWETLGHGNPNTEMSTVIILKWEAFEVSRLVRYISLPPQRRRRRTTFVGEIYEKKIVGTGRDGALATSPENSFKNHFTTVTFWYFDYIVSPNMTSEKVTRYLLQWHG